MNKCCAGAQAVATPVAPEMDVSVMTIRLAEAVHCVDEKLSLVIHSGFD